MSKPVIDYIDTQGLSPKMSPEEAAKARKNPQKHKPMEVRPRRLFTPEYAKEMKILINEVLDERDYKRKMRMSYDDVKPLPPSYFDTEYFKHRINEPEPPYESWQ